MLNTFLRDIADDTTGATAIEYGLIVSLIVIAMIAALNGFAGSAIGMWNNVSTQVNSVTGS
ncbi:Flp family type IVb pilin [Porphyrobacter sp. LM 6]|jgi:pilus assembly protein Flp/PilA|uniref:Flp family type IVb pilin n=1 Tax=Porphyrobacter sp. LM 6 TaxID=1896196 RepID=UPI000847967C|nr:Flp family type IVb pilin [Porphyrobacter sp. LM 6]AOL94642.1 pilus assembly protein Flp/PilA [Porphyrobacter sp. LM 6]